MSVGDLIGKNKSKSEDLFEIIEHFIVKDIKVLRDTFLSQLDQKGYHIQIVVNETLIEVSKP